MGSSESTERSNSAGTENGEDSGQNRKKNNNEESNIAKAAVAAAGLAAVAWGVSSLLSGSGSESNDEKMKARERITFNPSSSAYSQPRQLYYKQAEETCDATDTVSSQGWARPPSNWVKVNVDGSVKENPSTARIGGLIRDENGKWLVGFVMNIEDFSDIVKVELSAIYQGMDLAWREGHRNVLVESDSEQAVNWSSNTTAKRSSPYYELVAKCSELKSRNWKCKVNHISRKDNNCADWLASESLKCSVELTILPYPPEGIASRLDKEAAAVA